MKDLDVDVSGEDSEESEEEAAPKAKKAAAPAKKADESSEESGSESDSESSDEEDEDVEMADASKATAAKGQFEHTPSFTTYTHTHVCRQAESGGGCTRACQKGQDRLRRRGARRSPR